MNTQHLHSEQQRMTKILLVDDHALFRSGLRSLLQRQEDFEIVGEAADGLEGIKLVALLRPDVVLMDIDMPVMNGKEALSQILSSQPDLAVMMLTVSEDGNDLTECMRIGARGYLLKNINVDFLLDSIRRAVDGDSVLSPEMTAKLVARLRSPESNKQSTEIESLTPRERETLAWLAKGVSNKHIARGLDVAESTVKVHVQSILRKLNLSSRVQAAVYAVEHGLDKIPTE
jgi:two-component system nitrate/nitrite response regulator NarL